VRIVLDSFFIPFSRLVQKIEGNRDALGVAPIQSHRWRGPDIL
jgi:hypothetical protein